MPAESAVRSRNDHAFGLIETLRYEPEHGCIRAVRHLDRLTDSARRFNRAFNRTEAERLLESVAADKPLRVRLFLDEQDRLTCKTHDFTPVPEGAVWKVAIARTKLDSAETLLAHKTSQRGLYEVARAELGTDLADEILMENENGFLCEGTITSLFIRRGDKFVTPRLSHGLLRGVLRQELLDSGQAVDGDLTRGDLADAEIFVGNSLRGLIPAKLVENT
jgi:4-amino-4-deoxychorismate lyase